MKNTARFMCAVVISCTATAVAAQDGAQQPGSPSANGPGQTAAPVRPMTPDQLLPLPQTVAPVPAPSSILSTPLNRPSASSTDPLPPPVAYVPTLSSSSTACTGGGSS